MSVANVEGNVIGTTIFKLDELIGAFGAQLRLPLRQVSKLENCEQSGRKFIIHKLCKVDLNFFDGFQLSSVSFKYNKSKTPGSCLIGSVKISPVSEK